MDRYVTATKRPKPKAKSSKHDSAETADGSSKRMRSDTAGISEDDPQKEKEGNGAASSSLGFHLNEVKGDLFSSPTDECLAHCISEDIRMGKGIAKIFKEKFGGVKDLMSQGVKPGGVAVLRRGNRLIYYLVTKEKYWNKPTYDSLARSLRAMADHCAENNVCSVSMPRIGCGLDGLKWEKVVDVIRDAMGKTDITVTVYTL